LIVAISKKNKIENFTPYAYGFMAKAFEGPDIPDSAIYYYQRKNAILRPEERTDIMTQINYNINLGSLFVRKNNFEKALGYFEIAETLLKKYNKTAEMGLDTEMKMLLSLENLYSKTGDYKLAYDYGNRHKALVNERDNKENDLKVRELEGKYNNSQKQNVINKLKTELTFKDKIVKQQYTILGVVTLLGISGIMLFYLSVKRRRLKTEKERIELEQRLLLSQMNPHFMFNALSAIQKEIVMGNTKIANLYLTKYADLTRLILENSRQPFIGIDDELSILEYYLSLQKIRYTDKFDYLIEYSPELKKSFVSIPPMLIQPFIENSLEHGFEGINYKGFLKVNFLRKGLQLICTIDDNGKGGQFEKIKLKNSYSTTIVEERLAFLSKETGIKSSLNFFQKQSPELGYHVTITIPLHES
jgi:Histidine kinase